MTKKKADTKADHNNSVAANNNKIPLGWHLIKAAIPRKRLDYLRWGVAMLAAGICDLVKGATNGRP